jgi:hypothetical protein
VRVTGHIAGYDAALAKAADFSRLFDVSAAEGKLPLDDILLDVEGLQNMPVARGKLEVVGGGPWVRPTKAWVEKK